MQSWDDLKYLLAIARSRSLAGAARELGVNHSTVFRRLNAAEQRVGVRIFERLPEGYLPTAAGEDLLAAAARIEEQVLAIERGVLGADVRLTGSVRVTTVDDFAFYLLPLLLKKFRAKFPAIELEVITADALFDLTRREADVALRATNQPPPHLVGRNVGTVHWAIYGSRGYLRRRPFKKLGEWQDHSVIGPDASFSDVPPMRWWLSQVPQQAIALRVSNVLNTVAAAQPGIGLCLLPCAVGDRAQGLQRASETIDELQTGCWSLTHPDLRFVARIKAVMEFLAAEVPALLN